MHRIHNSTIYNTQDNGNNLNVHWRMGKEDVVLTSNGILLSHKEEWNNAICSDTDRSRDYPTKQERESEIPYDVTYVV